MNAAPGQGIADAPPAFLNRLERYFKENERAVAAVFFAAGFVFDMLTTGRIDSWATIGQQAVYLAVIMAVLLQMFREQGQPAPEPAGMTRLKRWTYEYRGPAVHFLLGALLNLYAIFFFKSSSLAVSFGFLGILVALVLANESRRNHGDLEDGIAHTLRRDRCTGSQRGGCHEPCMLAHDHSLNSVSRACDFG